MTVERICTLLHEEALRHEAIAKINADSTQAAEHREVAHALHLVFRLVLAVLSKVQARGKPESIAG